MTFVDSDLCYKRGKGTGVKMYGRMGVHAERHFAIVSA
jgi:hypothetical protein